MKILFDHGTPRPLRSYLTGHTVDTAADKGWDMLSNGDLLSRAEGQAYELLITTDQSMRHQQNIAGRRLAVIVLLSQSWPYTQTKIEEIQTAIREVRPGELREVRISMRGGA